VTVRRIDATDLLDEEVDCKKAKETSQQCIGMTDSEADELKILERA